MFVWRGCFCLCTRVHKHCIAAIGGMCKCKTVPEIRPVTRFAAAPRCARARRDQKNKANDLCRCLQPDNFEPTHNSHEKCPSLLHEFSCAIPRPLPALGRPRAPRARPPSAFAANTADNYTGSATGSLLTTGNWSLSALPSITSDAVYPSGAATGIRTLTAGNLTVGSFDVLATSGTLSIRNETATLTDSILTLGGSGDLGNGASGTAADLLYCASGSTFQILGDNPNGAGVLKLALGQNGNFNAVGTMIISSIITGSGFGFTKTGAGTLTLNGANAYSGATLVSAGTLTLGGFGASAVSSDITVTNATLAINSSSGTGVASITRGNNLTLQQSTLTLAGVASQITVDTFAGALNIGTGASAITLTPNAAANAQLKFSTCGTRASGSWVNITGTFGGAPGAGQANLLFTTAPSGANFIGGGGAYSTSTANIIPWLRNSSGGIYTYDSASRGVTAWTTIDTMTANANVSLGANQTLGGDLVVNALDASGGNVGITMASHKLTVSSGVVQAQIPLTIGSDTSTPGPLDFGTTEGILSARSSRTLTINSVITGSGGLTAVGFSGTTPNIVLAVANTFTGNVNIYGSGGLNFKLGGQYALQNATFNSVSGRGATSVFGKSGNKNRK